MICSTIVQLPCAHRHQHHTPQTYHYPIRWVPEFLPIQTYTYTNTHIVVIRRTTKKLLYFVCVVESTFNAEASPTRHMFTFDSPCFVLLRYFFSSSFSTSSTNTHISFVFTIQDLQPCWTEMDNNDNNNDDNRRWHE